MKVDVFFSNSIESSIVGVLKNIDKSKDISQDNVIICPDSFSLLIEKKMFECLNIDCAFNIKVIGISKLFQSLKMKTDLEMLNAFESEMIIRKIIIENLDSFKSIKAENESFSLCDEIYKTIAQLKANKITPEMLSNKEDKQTALTLKLQDLKLVYEKYEKEIEEKYVDSNDILTLIEGEIERNENVKNNDYYFVGFDSLTKQGYAILKALVKNSNRVVVGRVEPRNQQNAYLYELDLKDKLDEICNSLGVVPNVQSIPNVLNENQTQTLNNLLSLKPEKKEENGYFKLIEYPTLDVEINEVAKTIFEFVKNGKRYKDIQIAVCDLEKYKDLIEVVLSARNIPFYIDTKEKFMNLTISNFVLNFLKTLQETNYQNLTTFFQNEYVDILREEKNKISNYLVKYKYEGEDIFSNFSDKSEETEKILEFIKKTKKEIEGKHDINFFVDVINSIFDFFNLQDKIDGRIEKFKQLSELKKEKVYSQVMSKFEMAKESLLKVSKNEIVNFEVFVSLVEQLFSCIEISTIPISVDCVYVGDMMSSYFENKDVMFVVGASEGKCPFYASDCGIISDSDIEEMKNKFQVEPSIKMINRRNRFKVFQNFTSAKEHLFVSFISQNDEGKQALPSSFASGFLQVFDEKYCSFMEYVSLNENKEEYIVKNCQTENDIRELIVNAEKNGNEEVKNILSFFAEENGIALSQKREIEEEINEPEKLFMNKNKSHITQIQNYFKCPFKHFVQNGLKIKEKEDALLKAKDFGNIIHRCLEVFGKEYKNEIGQLENTCDIANDIYKKVLKEDDFKDFALAKENKELLIKLNREVRDVFEMLNYQQKQSKMKIEMCEKPFKQEVDVDGFKIVFSGIIDRVDVDEERKYFKIVDYKTGTLHSDLKLIYHGEDLQVLLYSHIIENEMKLKPIGSFYFPISDDFMKHDEKRCLKGYFIGEEELVKKLDKRIGFDFPQSDIYNLKIKTSQKHKKDGIFEMNSSSSDSFSEEGYYNLCKLTLKTIAKAIEEIKQGNISATGLDDECENCSYKALCNSANLKVRNYVLNSKNMTESFVSKILEGAENE